MKTKGIYGFFSRLDVVKGYYQVPVINASREKAAVLLLLEPTFWGWRFCFCLPGRYLTSLSTVHICESFKRRQRAGLAINSSWIGASSLPASLDSSHPQQQWWHPPFAHAHFEDSRISNPSLQGRYVEVPWILVKFPACSNGQAAPAAKRSDEVIVTFLQK